MELLEKWFHHVQNYTLGVPYNIYITTIAILPSKVTDFVMQIIID